MIISQKRNRFLYNYNLIKLLTLNYYQEQNILLKTEQNSQNFNFICCNYEWKKEEIEEERGKKEILDKKNKTTTLLYT